MTEGKKHRLIATAETVHTGFFDASLAPVLRIASGDTVVMDSLTLLDGRLHADMTLHELIVLRGEYYERKTGTHTLTGPIYVEGAEPGDALEVQIQKFTPGESGVNYHFPGKLGTGGLPEDFPNGQIKKFQWDPGKMETAFAPGIVLPLSPFFGVMGVAPKRGEKRSSSIPDYFGGNLDNKELVAGTTLFLPVSVPGALFSAGDAHAVQGDGEVNVTAIETSMREAVLRFFVRKELGIERPMAETPTHWITMGFHQDLNEAVKIALRDAIRFISVRHGLSRDDAYSLSSLAVDLRVTQIVDGNKGVHAMIPREIFKKGFRLSTP
ncbi:MAG TPA: acetamidase/formamidase family protein [Thermodesulfobacteriota bacterium]|nr:acetamidase/formamidase family protein [Thermodesulfobacteriota bacterium]